MDNAERHDRSPQKARGVPNPVQRLRREVGDEDVRAGAQQRQLGYAVLVTSTSGRGFSDATRLSIALTALRWWS